jgi:hypothetical protein
MSFPHHVIYQEGTMIRERGLKGMLVLVELPYGWDLSTNDVFRSEAALAMMLSLYVTLGIFLLDE